MHARGEMDERPRTAPSAGAPSVSGPIDSITTSSSRPSGLRTALAHRPSLARQRRRDVTADESRSLPSPARRFALAHRRSERFGLRNNSSRSGRHRASIATVRSYRAGRLHRACRDRTVVGTGRRTNRVCELIGAARVTTPPSPFSTTVKPPRRPARRPAARDGRPPADCRTGSARHPRHVLPVRNDPELAPPGTPRARHPRRAARRRHWRGLLRLQLLQPLEADAPAGQQEVDVRLVLEKTRRLEQISGSWVKPRLPDRPTTKRPGWPCGTDCPVTADADQARASPSSE